MVLLLVAHHGNIGSCTRDTLGLAIPYDWVLSSCSLLLLSNDRLLLDLLWLHFLLATENIRPFVSKATQVLSDIISACKGCICLPLDHMLLFLFPFGVEHAHFEVLSPFNLLDNWLTVRALLRSFRLWNLTFVSGIFSRLAHIVFYNFHLGIKCRSFGQVVSLHDFARLLIISLYCATSDLIRIRHALEFLIFLHVLLHLFCQ